MNLLKKLLTKKNRAYLYYYAKAKNISEKEALNFFLECGILKYEQEKKIHLSKAIARLTGEKSGS